MDHHSTDNSIAVFKTKQNQDWPKQIPLEHVRSKRELLIGGDGSWLSFWIESFDAGGY